MKFEKSLMFMGISNLVIAVAVLIMSIVIFNQSPQTAVAGDAKQPVQQHQKASKDSISKKFDKGITLEKALKKNKPVAVLFYADWCGFCQRFAPLYSDLSKDKELRRLYTFAYMNSEDPKNVSDLRKFEVRGFPTLYLINPKTNDQVRVPNSFMFQPDAYEVMKDKFKLFLEDGSAAIVSPEEKPAEPTAKKEPVKK